MFRKARSWRSVTNITLKYIIRIYILKNVCMNDFGMRLFYNIYNVESNRDK